MELVSVGYCIAVVVVLVIVVVVVWWVSWRVSLCGVSGFFMHTC